MLLLLLFIIIMLAAVFVVYFGMVKIFNKPRRKRITNTIRRITDHERVKKIETFMLKKFAFVIAIFAIIGVIILAGAWNSWGFFFGFVTLGSIAVMITMFSQISIREAIAFLIISTRYTKKDWFKLYPNTKDEIVGQYVSVDFKKIFIKDPYDNITEIECDKFLQAPKNLITKETQHTIEIKTSVPSGVILPQLKNLFQNYDLMNSIGVHKKADGSGHRIKYIVSGFDISYNVPVTIIEIRFIPEKMEKFWEVKDDLSSEIYKQISGAQNV